MIDSALHIKCSLNWRCR